MNKKNLTFINARKNSLSKDEKLNKVEGQKTNEKQKFH